MDGFKVALDNLDKTIKIIRKSKEPSDAKEALIKQLKISEVQSTAILELRLQRLTGMEQERILDERKLLIKRIKEINKILADDKEINNIMISEIRKRLVIMVMKEKQ